jgi:propionyl-CoA carboxylase alpha chain
MFDKILIANRGEIACRVIRTARAMGIKTVAVYSEADMDALHVEMADEAVGIGPSAASESYLVGERIIAAAAETGAQAIHPGYGFLSENKSFAEALAGAGITFIGPPVGAIEAMGDKIASKKLALAAGVSTVPGHTEAISDPEKAVGIARDIGYPVMLKASAGGGGKGMRIARNDDEVREGLVSAANEARSSFGDDRVFVEKFVEQPRHIEIQILADQHGNYVYLGERECSIQRRHQKVVEEAPSPFLDPQTRAAMGEQAVALARAVDYHSAGTVEFIVDADKNFYFLEMNTRLQVEHPVTEAITGIDLVEEMLRVAAGEKLRMTQDGVKLEGWSVETRIYAEDPYRDFVPSIGRLTKCRPPAQSDTVRVDTGVVEGSEITVFYDPMIAKLITYGRDRSEAVAAMSDALDAYYLRGINHNVAFLNAIMRHPRFRSGDMTTAFIEEEYPDGFAGAPLEGEVRDALISCAVLIRVREIYREWSISGQMPLPRPKMPQQWVVQIEDEAVSVAMTNAEDGLDVGIGDRLVAIRSDWQPGDAVFRGLVDSRRVSLQIDHLNDGYRLTHGGVSAGVVLRRPEVAELAAHMPIKEVPDTSKFLLCPMPGLVISIEVVEGDDVKAGQALAVVEAMKMENILRAERDGTVAAVKAAAGDSLAVDEVILEFA